MKKHELIPSDKQGLFRVKALIDFGDVKAGNVGGYVASERNLSQAGSCWVYGNARVYDNARVSGNARVYGTAKATKPVINLINVGKHNITITDTHIAIGCENHTIEHWKKNIKKIGLDNGYTKAEIKKTITIL